MTYPQVDAVLYAPYTVAMTAIKHVGRNGQGSAIEQSRVLQRTISRLRGRWVIPRGVYKFSTHEEANQWMTQTVARTHARRKSKTS